MVKGIDGNGIHWGNIWLIDLFYPFLFHVGYRNLVFYQKAFFFYAMTIKAAHEMHHGAHIGQLAVGRPLLFLGVKIRRHIPEKGIAIVGNDMRSKITDKAFEAVFQLITKRLVFYEQWLGGSHGKFVALDIKMKP